MYVWGIRLLTGFRGTALRWNAESRVFPFCERLFSGTAENETHVDASIQYLWMSTSDVGSLMGPQGKFVNDLRAEMGLDNLVVYPASPQDPLSFDRRLLRLAGSDEAIQKTVQVLKEKFNLPPMEQNSSNNDCRAAVRVNSRYMSELHTLKNASVMMRILPNDSNDKDDPMTSVVITGPADAVQDMIGKVRNHFYRQVVWIPADQIPRLIGKRGNQIKVLRETAKVRSIEIKHDTVVGDMSPVEINGPYLNVQLASSMIMSSVSDATFNAPKVTRD